MHILLQIGLKTALDRMNLTEPVSVCIRLLTCQVTALSGGPV